LRLGGHQCCFLHDEIYLCKTIGDHKPRLQRSKIYDDPGEIICWTQFTIVLKVKAEESSGQKECCHTNRAIMQLKNKWCRESSPILQSEQVGNMLEKCNIELIMEVVGRML
jgi:hypothetical protein